jgi:hypothetical protein
MSRCLPVRAGIPAIGSLRQACTYLTHLRVPLFHDDAVERLTRWRDSLTLLALYEANFPEAFAHSTADLLADPDDPFGPRELEFFDLVEQHLFYFNQDWYVETCYDAWSLSFPIPRIGVEICMCNDTFDEHPLGWQLLILLVGATTATTAELPVPPEVRAELSLLLDGPMPDGHLDWERFTDLAQTHPALGHRFVTAIAALDQSTGNVFLDQACCQDYQEAYWSQDWIDQLTVAFAEAEDLMAEANEFVEWLTADPIPRMQEVVSVWRAAFL